MCTFKPYTGPLNYSEVKITTFYEVVDGMPDSRIPNAATAEHLPTGITVHCPIVESMAFARGYLVRELELQVFGK
jgi:hypothetical protein